MFTIILALIPLLMMIQTALAQQGPTQCHDPAMTRWMLNSEGENPCEVVQEVMRVCNPSFSINWLTSAYSCDNGPTSISAACCCGSPTFALLSACWSCQYNYTLDIVSTTFTAFERDCASIPTPLTSYDPIIRSKVDQIDIPLWAKIEPMAGKWDLTAAWRNATPTTTTSPPVPTSYPISTPNTLSSGAIIGVVVGSVFGTALMFILAAVTLWRCLGLGRQRQQANDIRVGQDMGYLDGEYVYVRSANQENATGEAGLGVSLAGRLKTRRDSRGLRPRAEVDLDASDYEASRHLSDYEDDYRGSSRALRPHSHARSRSPSYLDPHSPSFAEPPSPFSPARHASLDGRYQGYHPGSSPNSVHRTSLDGPRQFEGPYRPSWEHADSYRSHREPHRPSREHSRERGYRMSGSRSPRPISGHFSQHRPSGERFSSRGSADPYQGRASADRYSEYRASRDRPASGQFNSRPVSGQFGGRPRSGQFTDYRTSAERKRDHRVSVRSGLRHMSLDSTRRSGDSGGRFTRIEDQRSNRDGSRFGREEVRFSRDGGPRYREGRQASLSEGDEDRRGHDDEGSVDEEPPRRSETTSSDYGRRGYQQHLRKRSQSARTSCDPGHGDLMPMQERAEGAGPSILRLRDVPASAPMSSTTSNKESSASVQPPSTKLRSGTHTPLRLTNPSPSMDMHSSEGTSHLQPPVTRDPSLLARARTLMNPSTSRASRPSSAGLQSQASTSQIPPSAWQRLPTVLRRISSGSPHTSSSKPRTSLGSESLTGSDAATTVYHTAQGHTPSTGGNGTPVTEFGQQADLSAGELQTSYRQESDAGVQLVVEHSPESLPQAEIQDRTDPPAYVDRRSSDAGSLASRQFAETASGVTHAHSQSSLLPQNHSDPELGLSAGSAHPMHNRLSTLTRDTDLDSTVSSGVIQTWTAARRPTGFVGLGRVMSNDGHAAESHARHANEVGAVGDVHGTGADQRTSHGRGLSVSLMDMLPTAAPTVERAEGRS